MHSQVCAPGSSIFELRSREVNIVLVIVDIHVSPAIIVGRHNGRVAVENKTLGQKVVVLVASESEVHVLAQEAASKAAPDGGLCNLSPASLHTTDDRLS